MEWHFYRPEAPDHQGAKPKIEPAQLKVSAQGRVVIPAEMRRDLGLRAGETLVARIEGDRLILEKPANVLRRLKGRFAGLSGSGGSQGVSLAEELIAERREEARREEDS